MYIINKVNDIPIRLKFTSVYLVCVLLPMIIIYAIFFTRISDEVELREGNLIEQTIDSTEADLAYLITGGRSIARDIVLDQDINELVDMEYPSSAQYYDIYYNTLRDLLDRFASSYNNVIRVSIYTDNPTIISGGNVIYLDDTVKESEWFSKYQIYNNDEQIISWIEPNPIYRDTYAVKVSIIRELKGFSLFDHYKKYVKIDFQNESIENSLKTDFAMDYVLLNDQGEQLMSTIADNRLNKPILNTFDLSPYQKSNIITTRDIDLLSNQNWKLIGIAYKSNLLDQISNYGLLVLLLFVISLLLSLFMIYIFANSYNSRIQLLQHHMKMVQNSQFNIITEDTGKDEIGYLIHSFNAMTLQINDLVNEVLEFQLRDKEHQLESVKAELKFLQSQMDPHFLFNTLNAILVVCNRNHYEEVTEIIKYLSKTLRYLIQWNDELVTIEKEITFTMMYLTIEKFRFQEKFHFDIDLEKGLDDILIPKMLIQPFVENACKHGIQGTKNSGLVHIRIYMSNDQVNVVIKDNGIGMLPDKLKSILEPQKEDHIGIQNVLRRLKLYYGDSYHISIRSSYGEGTTVLIQLPRAELLREGEVVV